MTKTALLHIGTRKTGTTAIQNMLADGREDLAPVRYPLMKPDRDQNRLVTLYLPRDQWPVQWRHVRPRTRRRYRRFISKELASADAAIISGEALSSWFDLAAARKLREDLERFGFQRFHVILYVRDPADYYLSFMQQILKVSADGSPRGFHPASFRYELKRTALTWEEAFPGSLVVRKFPAKSESDICADFCAQVSEYLGISLPRTPTRMNETISAEAMQIIQDYRLAFWPNNGGILTRDAARLVKFLMESTTDIPQNNPVLKPAVAECIRANHKQDAEFIYDRYGVELGLRDAQPTQLRIDRNFRVGDLIQTLDPEVVRALMLRLAKSELEKAPPKRSLALRLASRVRRVIPV